nr:immunoglobulin light chain junction region [Macaca mulatta]
CSSCADSNVFF